MCVCEGERCVKQLGHCTRGGEQGANVCVYEGGGVCETTSTL